MGRYYERRWLTLGEALGYVQSTGLSRDEAMSELCDAIADGAISIRVRVDESDGDLGGKELQRREQINVPEALIPEDFDWERSRPHKPWSTRLHPVFSGDIWAPPDSHLRNWKERPIVIELFATDLQRIWWNDTTAATPPPPASAQTSESARGRVSAVAEPALAHGVQRNVGGRPPKYDWDAFAREIVRLANTPDGLPKREELHRYMLDWCEKAWGDAPAESTVRERIARLYPG
jgi:hypothetical protein